jgi:flagellar hook assembly protein FlgD
MSLFDWQNKRLSTGLFIIILLQCSILIAQSSQSIDLVTVDDDSELVTILPSDADDPFGKEAKIRFRLNDSVKVHIRIVTPMGATIRHLADQELNAGIHTLTWDGTDDRGQQLSSGVFMCEIRTEHITRSTMLAVLN